MKIAILGAGMVGSTIAYELSKKYEVTSFDISQSSLEKIKHQVPNASVVQADLTNLAGYNSLLQDFDFVVSAVPGFMGFNTLEAILKAGKNVADISFFPEDALALDNLAKDNNVTAIVDCGVAPGLSNYTLGYYDSKITVSEFECLVGGLPVKRTKPFEYKAPFSPVDVIEEYTRPARLKENGVIIEKKALSEPELVDFSEVGTLESFNTDGLRSLLYTLPHIPNMKERTLRYPGHIDLIESMLKAGFFDTKPMKLNGIEFSPLEFSSAILFNNWKLNPGDEEFTIMRITIQGKNEKGNSEKIMYHLFDTNDKETQLSSMSRTTGFTCCASLELIMTNQFRAKGVFPPELVGKNEGCFEFILHYLAERNVSFLKN